MVSAYQLSLHRPIFSHISIGCIVADIANGEFRMRIFDLLSCVGDFPLSSLHYENVQDKIAHSGSFKVTESDFILVLRAVFTYVFSWE